MDPYDVLGIRPTAVSEEVELAYRGRRSQYHPDRYAQLDSDTQAWATRKMQELNEAYRLISSPELRAKVDRQPQTGGSNSRASRQTQNNSAQRQRDVASVLLKPEWKWFYDKVHARPSVPMRKAEGAIDSYASDVSLDDVIVLLDDTVFGGAREGVLVTNEAIYGKQKFESANRILLRQIEDVSPGVNSRIMINGAVFFEANVIEHIAVANFASRLSTAIKALDK